MMHPKAPAQRDFTLVCQVFIYLQHPASWQICAEVKRFRIRLRQRRIPQEFCEEKDKIFILRF